MNCRQSAPFAIYLLTHDDCMIAYSLQSTVFEPYARQLLKLRREMRPIAIIPRDGREIALELYDSMTCLREAGINPREAVVGVACALIWVDDESISFSVERLRTTGFQATALIA
ncbi:MAG: hypothetical protein JO166_14685 [Deltaproteobacteria bacterium]|nr:hypothetical protein [Deltaproteobacteria bacterium]